MTLALLTETDLDLILPWRNAPAVRQAMYIHHEISPDEHRLVPADRRESASGLRGTRRR